MILLTTFVSQLGNSRPVFNPEILCVRACVRACEFAFTVQVKQRPHRCCSFVNKVENIDSRHEYAQELPFPKMPFLVCGRSGPHLIQTWWFLGPYESTHKRHLDRFSHFLQGWRLWPTERPRYMCSSRPHPMLCTVMQFKSYFASPHPARRVYMTYLWPTSVMHIFNFSCYFANFQFKRQLKLFAVSIWNNFDSIFKPLQITLVASSNANEAEDIDLGRVWACPSITL